MWQQALADWPLQLAEVLVFGTALFALAIAPREISQCEELTCALRRIWRGLALATLLAAPIAMLHQVSAVTGLPFRDAMRLVPEVMRRTHAGRIWVARSVAVPLLMLVAWTNCRGLRQAAGLFAVSTLLLLLNSLSAHAIDKGPLALAAHLIHQAAAAAWFGAILGMSVATRVGSADPERAEQMVHVVSKLAGWSVTVLIVAGACVGYATLGLSLDHLLYSAYGRTLVVKLALFGLAVGVGGYNRYRLLPAVGSSGARAALPRNVGLECLLLAGVLGLAALLANTPPAH